MVATGVVRQSEVEKDCFTPRDYQVELLDKACARNVIVQLGTGAGKTFIAVLLIKEYALQLVAPYEETGKRCWFIVDKVSLVTQQADHIECHTSLKVGKMHGTLNQDVKEDKDKFDQFIRDHHVIVVTAQILLDLIDHSYFRMEKAALLIFDECHHAMGIKHPYRVIMDRYSRTAEADRPRILGLTASLINDKTAPNLLEAKLAKLEAILDSSIETASSLVTVSKFGAKPNELVVKAADYDHEAQPVNKTVMELLKATREFCDRSRDFHPDLDLDPRKPIIEAINRTLAVMRQIGPWAAWKVSALWEKELRKHSKSTAADFKQVDFFQLGETCMRTVKRMLDPKMKPIRSFAAIKEHLPHKVVRLMDILSTYHPERNTDPDRALCGIVFVDQRYVAYVMNVLIKSIARWDPQFAFVKVDFVIGFSGGSFASNTESQALHKRQEEVLRKFRRGELNLLIATNVLEEGVDVRHCNLVIKFDRPADFRAYVQSKGRARKPGAHYFVLIESADAAKCSEDLKDFKQIEELLLRRYRTVHNPPGSLLEELPANVDSLVPPYRVEETGAMVTLTGAIALVNRYCAKLPSDIFTRLVPQSRITPVVVNGVTRYTAELLLPINSPIKKAIRLMTPMENKKLAQMAVALEACAELHRQGELNKWLLPVGRESMAEQLMSLDDDPDEFVPGMNARVGSAKRKQLYDKRVSRALHECRPRAEVELYMYVLDMELVKPPTEQSNPKKRKFADPKSLDGCFGFLSATKIPQIPAFPAYLRQGDMRVRVRRAANTVRLHPCDLDLAADFHHYLFKNVLMLHKPYIDFSLDTGTPTTPLIVPLVKTDGDWTINWGYVRDVCSQAGEMPRVPSEEERKRFKFRAEDYRDAVVMPWYRNVDQPNFYYVAEILDDMSPSSAFPDSEFASFNEYFIKKYNLEIFDQQQCLLDVDYTSNRLNLLLPRNRWQRAKPRSEAAAAAAASQKQILVPELMDRHPISASLWNSISALPSFFYRINALLLADELRERIVVEALEADKAAARPGDEFEWPPLSYPATLEERGDMIVSKIQQLRDLNKQKEQAVEQSGAVGGGGDGDFEIGVWDPEAAMGMDWSCSMPPGGTGGEGAAMGMGGEEDGDRDTVGLMTGASMGGDLSDDEDAEAVVLFDFARRFGDGQAKSAEASSFAAPRADIVECGWGDLDADVGPVDAAAPFTLLTGGTPLIDMTSFMADLQRQILPQQPAPPAAAPAAPAALPAQEQKRQTAVAAPIPAAPVKPPPLYLDEMEMLEDRERDGCREETVDLIEFDEEDDDVLSTRAALSSLSVSTGRDSDEECSELDRGEREKERRDRRGRNGSGERSEATVLAPPLDKAFSFRDASASASVLSVVDKERDESMSCAESAAGLPAAPHAPQLTHSFGVSPCMFLTALTTANANDGMNLERLETIGDSFLKYAVTECLFVRHGDQHEGKLSFARSKEVSNCNLYRLGKRAGIPALIIASKFDAHESWLPPCYVPNQYFKAPNSEDAAEKDEAMENVLDGKEAPAEQLKTATGWDVADADPSRKMVDGVETITFPKAAANAAELAEISPLPYNMLTQQYISDKAIADAVEALIGAHLLTLGPKDTLKVMKWLGLKVLTEVREEELERPLLRFIDTPEEPHRADEQLNDLWGKFRFAELEERIGYKFKERAYLLQAFTHASYYHNRVTGCYQRLEFLGDAVLDYMITRFLFEHDKQYSPGVLTDLRSALVNNTIFASLAVKYEFHKHFVAMCPGLHHMIEKFVRMCKEKNFFEANFNAEMYMVTTEDEIDEGQEEDIEVPKAMGDVFESLAGAVYLDSGRDLDVVWRVFHFLMKDTITVCCANPPRSPIRELLELEPDRARFSKLERIMESGKVRVTVEISKLKMRFTGMGRSYKIAKATAAKRALRYLKSMEEQKARENAAKVSALPQHDLITF